MNPTLAARYEQLCHAHQSGVKFDLENDPSNYLAGPVSGRPDIMRIAKHLRVGIDGALVEQSAVARLLMEKGVFTEAEYHTAIIVAREQEVERYEKYLSEKFGVKTTLV